MYVFFNHWTFISTYPLAEYWFENCTGSNSCFWLKLLAPNCMWYHFLDLKFQKYHKYDRLTQRPKQQQTFTSSKRFNIPVRRQAAKLIVPFQSPNIAAIPILDFFSPEKTKPKRNQTLRKHNKANEFIHFQIKLLDFEIKLTEIVSKTTNCRK